MAYISILCWYSTSLSLSLYNKWLFSKDHHAFKYPLFVTFFHNLLQFVISAICLSTCFVKMQPKRLPGWRNYFLKVMPCGLATGLDIGLSNLSLKTITLTFYTMVKSGAPVFVLLFAFLFKLEKPTCKLIGIMGIIVFGVLLMVIQQTDFHLVGYLQIQSATVASGFRWALTQLLLEKEALGMNNPLATNLFLSPLMAVSLLIVSVSLEDLHGMVNSPFFATFGSTVRISVVIFSGGILAFLMLIAEFRLISATSVITFSVAGIVKEILTISVSHMVFGDKLNALNIVGLVISIVGIAMYNYVRIQAILKKPHSPLPRNHADIDESSYLDTMDKTALSSATVGYHPVTGIFTPSDDEASVFELEDMDSLDEIHTD